MKSSNNQNQRKRYKRPGTLRKAAAAVICLGMLLAHPLSGYAAGGDLYDNTNGLITSTVNDACQTSDGYIWIAQYEGLSRFDGEKFQCINQVTADGQDIALEQLTNVENDSLNNLYIGTKMSGVLQYKDGEYHKMTEDAGLNVNDIYVDDDIVYVATTDGAYYYQDGQVTWLSDTTGNGIKSISASNSKIYYADESGIAYVYDGSSKVFFSDKKIRTIRAYQNTVWLGSSYGDLICISPDGKQNFPVVTNQSINTLSRLDDVIYIGTDNGLYVYDSGEIKRIHNAHTDTSIQNIFFDYERSMWLSTPGGLLQQHRYSIDNISDNYGVNTASVNACFYYKNLLYAGTDNGIYIIDEANEKLVTNALSEKLEGIRVRDFQELDGKLYVATYSSEEYAVLVFDGKNIQLISAQDMLTGEQDSELLYQHGQVRRLCTMGDKMLIGTNYGLTLADHGLYKTVPLTPRPLSMTVIDDKIYVCTDGDGIHVLDKDLNDTETVSGTEGETPLCVIPYGEGILYGCGTGLFYAENNTTQRLNTTNIGSIVELREINEGLLMYTSGGATLLDTNTLFDEEVSVIKLFNATSGLNSGVTANGRSVYLEGTGENYFNCTNGIYKYNRKTAFKEADTMKLAVEGISEDGQDIAISDAITVDKHSRRLTIDLALLTYMDRQNLTIHYQMLGMDKAEAELDFNSKQSIDYTNLRGGTYTLRIYAENASGIRSNEINNSDHQAADAV